MSEQISMAILAGLLGVALWLQQREREAWGRERAALIERLVPGVRLVETAAPAATSRAYGTDHDEWMIEQERLKAGGYIDPYAENEI